MNDLNDEFDLPPQKGLGQFRHRSLRAQTRDASRSVRRWWWEYLRLSKDYWMLCQTSTKGKPETQHEAFAKIFLDFGNIYDTTFEDWWMNTGSNLFAERSDPPKVKQINPRAVSPEESRSSIFVEIPLTLSYETVQNQIRRILDTYSDVRPGNRLETSTSDYPIAVALTRLS